MSLNALLAVRSALMVDPALTAFFVDRYGKAAKHVVGYKRSANANDFPLISYVPAITAQPDSVGGMSKGLVSLIISLNEPEITNDIYDGIVQADIAAQLVFDRLDKGELGNGAAYLAEGKSRTDLGKRHPFYEIELSMLLGAR